MWTQNKLFQPQNPKPEIQEELMAPQPYPILEGYMSTKEMAEVLGCLVFTTARKNQRAVYLTQKARNKLVTALLSSSPTTSLKATAVSLSVPIVKRSEIP